MTLKEELRTFRGDNLAPEMNDPMTADGVVRQARRERARVIGTVVRHVFREIRNSRIGCIIRRRRERNRTLNELRQLDRNTLWDIGFTPNNLKTEVDTLVFANENDNQNRSVGPTVQSKHHAA